MKKMITISVLMVFAVLFTPINISKCLAAPPVNTNDFTVLGVASDAKKADIIDSLGKPTKEGFLRRSMDAEYFVAYGGVTFDLTTSEDDASIVSIAIENRDALTARGVGIGDTESKVIRAYGERYQIVNSNGLKEYRYIWGRPGTDDAYGLSFSFKNGRLFRVIIHP